MSVHPHGCGERQKVAALFTVKNRFIPTDVGNATISGLIACTAAGSSPRMWGTHVRWSATHNKRRFIPTDVGNASTKPNWLSTCTVHPHGCGERYMRGSQWRVNAGSSPRMWGTLQTTDFWGAVSRFIPTDVGNAFSVKIKVKCVTVHPHGCGEREHRF